MGQEPVTIVIAGGGTGGHVQPAIAVTEKLRQTPNVSIHWIGSTTGIEEQVARDHNIPFRSIPTGKLRRYFSLHTAADAVRIPAGIARARLHLRKIQPDAVFSTGGFVSVPTVVAAWLAGIPVITHEQTATVGLANRINARLTDRIALAYEQTRGLIPHAADRTVVTGNPVRGELLAGNAERARKELGFPDDVPVVYVTGGSLGAQVLNNTVSTIISRLIERACVIHQCGPAAMNGDYPRLLKTRQGLPGELREHYVVRERIGPELADIYALADLVVGRSGGGTVAELALLGKPSILVPLPGTSSDEQTRNAAVLADAGAAILLRQLELTGDRLLAHIETLLADQERRDKMAESARSVAQPDAADLLALEILNLANPPRHRRDRAG